MSTTEKFLPIFPLQYPTILLPTSRISIPVSHALAVDLVKLAQGAQVPILGAVPRHPPVHGPEASDPHVEGQLQSWGCRTSLSYFLSIDMGDSCSYYPQLLVL